MLDYFQDAQSLSLATVLHYLLTAAQERAASFEPPFLPKR